MQYTTEDIPVKKEYYYIISFRQFLNLTLYGVYFINKNAAKEALVLHINRNKRSKYQIINGAKLKQYKLTYNISLGVLSKFCKYTYPDNCITGQSRKTYRTVMRRRLRRMGMLTLIKPKFKIREPIKHSRLIVNKQKVAMSPNSIAKAFRLQRKPAYYYYMLISKKRSKKNGIMFRAKTLRYNSKTGVFKMLYINIQNRDIIIPYLLSQVYSIAQDKSTENYEKLKARYIKICSKEKNKVLQKVVA